MNIDGTYTGSMMELTRSFREMDIYVRCSSKYENFLSKIQSTMDREDFMKIATEVDFGYI